MGCLVTGENSFRIEPAGERYFLLVVGALLVAYTLTPFDFDFSLPVLKSRVGHTLKIELAEVWGDVGHFVGFSVFGALLASVYEKFIRRVGFVRFMALCALFCVVLECGQLALPTRHARIADLIVNAFGLWMGARGSLNGAWVQTARLARFKFHHRRLMFSLFIVASLASGAWFSAAVYPLTRLTRLDWDPNFHLLIGSELDNDDGAWLGEIRSLRIYGRAWDGEMDLLADQRSAGSEAYGMTQKPDLLIGYDFTKTARDIVTPTGRLESDGLSMQVPALCQWLGEGKGLLLQKPALLMSRAPATHLSEAIISSGEFSVEAWVRPSDKFQGLDGPARVVSLSQSIWVRNFMLGQEGSDLVFRVRNGINGPNGLRYALRVRKAFRDVFQHIVASYDHGVSAVFRDGRLLKPVLDLRDPTVYARLGNSAGGHGVAGVLIVLLVALPVYHLCSFVRLEVFRHALAILAAFAIGSLPYLICCLMIGGPWRLGLVMGQGISLSIAYPLALFFVRQPCLPRVRIDQ